MSSGAGAPYTPISLTLLMLNFLHTTYDEIKYMSPIQLMPITATFTAAKYCQQNLLF